MAADREMAVDREIDTGTEHTAKPIVVGVDGSPYSAVALRWALDAGARLGCPVRALLVWHASPAIGAGRPTSIPLATTTPPEVDPEQVRTLDRTVRGVLGDRDDPRLSAEVVNGSVVDVLVAASTGAQLLVLGSHGHGRLVEATLGTVSQYCVRHAGCPVVIIPARLASPVTSTETVPAGGNAPGELAYGPGPLL